MTKTVGDLIAMGHDNTSGIQKLFTRWDIFDKAKIPIEKTVTEAVGKIIDVEVIQPKEEEEVSSTAKTSNGIKYEIFSGTIGKSHSIDVNIDGEEFYFSSFGFNENGKNFNVWLQVISEDNTSTVIQNQLIIQTKAISKNLKDAVDKMLRNIQKILKSSDSKKKILAEQIRKYKK